MAVEATLENLQKEVGQICKKASASFAKLTWDELNHIASRKLKTRLHIWNEAVSIAPEGDFTWVIKLDPKHAWLNDGYPTHSMLGGLLSSKKAKTAKDGSRYLIIPFLNTAGKSGPTYKTPSQQDIVTNVKSALKKAKTSFSAMDKLPGSNMPVPGRIKNLNVKTPLKTHEGGGQGHGKIGEVRVGNTGIPFMERASILQHYVKGKVERSVGTFRVASSKHMGTGKWIAPAMKATRIFEEAYAWAQREMVSNIIPGLNKDFAALFGR